MILNEAMTREGDVGWIKTAEGYAIDFVIFDETGEPDIEGFYRWDGCVNWRTIGNNYAHMCGGIEGIDRLHKNLLKLSEIADRELPE